MKKIREVLLLVVIVSVMLICCGNSFAENCILNPVPKIHNIEDVTNFIATEMINDVNEFIEDDEEKNKTYLGEFNLTAYCPCAKCCGRANAKCANGEYPIEGVTIAADLKKVPIGTKVHIDGIGERVVMDSGSAIKGNKLDVFINSHEECLIFGIKKNVKVWIIEE